MKSMVRQHPGRKHSMNEGSREERRLWRPGRRLLWPRQRTRSRERRRVAPARRKGRIPALLSSAHHLILSLPALNASPILPTLTTNPESNQTPLTSPDLTFYYSPPCLLPSWRAVPLLLLLELSKHVPISGIGCLLLLLLGMLCPQSLLRFTLSVHSCLSSNIISSERPGLTTLDRV